MVTCKHCGQEHDQLELLACFKSQVKCWRAERDSLKEWGECLREAIRSAEVALREAVPLMDGGQARSCVARAHALLIGTGAMDRPRKV